MTEIKRGEIWIVNLDPTKRHEINKSRPAVIIQNNLGNKYSTTTIIAPMTSQNTENVFPWEVLLTTKNSKLIKESKVLLNQIRVVDKSRITKRVGNVDIETMPLIDRALKISLGLNLLV